MPKNDKNIEALAVQEPTIMAAFDGSDNAAIIAENLGGSISLKDLDKIKVPSGGGTNWEILTAEGEVSSKTVTGVIVGWADKRAYWASAFGTQEVAPPNCSSDDMVYGKGNPNAFINTKEQELINIGEIPAGAEENGRFYVCDTCPHSKFGTALNGEGKACKETRFLVILPPDSVIPILLRVPPTSIPSLRDYFKRLASGKVAYYHAITELSLVKTQAKNAQITYSMIAAKAVRFLEGEELAAAKAYNIMVMPMLKAASVHTIIKDAPVSDEEF